MPGRFVIIGMGVAGISAAETIRSQDAAAEIILISSESNGYYSLPGVAYYLSDEIPDDHLSPWSSADFKKLRLIILKSHVTQLDPPHHQVILQDGRRLVYDRLLLATGAQSLRPDIPGINLPGVVTLDNLADARLMVKLSRKASSAVVVGGGITALEIVEGLRVRRVSVHYFLRGDRYWSNVLDEDESRIIENRLREDKVTIHYQTELAEIKGHGKRVSGVITRSGEVIGCDMVAIAIGVLPRKELAEQAGIKTDRGILVNEFLQTNEPDIYAAGDVAQVFDPFTGKHSLSSLWNLARAQGQITGLNMTGAAKPYQKAASINVTRLAGLPTTIIGSVGQGRDNDLVAVSRGDSEAWSDLPDSSSAESDFKINHLRLLIGEKHLFGAVLIGDQTLSYPLQVLVGEKIDITPIRAQLLTPGVDTTIVIANFWLSWSKK